MEEIAITAINAHTPVGHGAAMTAASVRAGLTRFTKSEEFKDSETNPITMAQIKGMDDKNTHRAERLAAIADHCLAQMLEIYFAGVMYRPPRIHLFLGVAASQRPGPRYEKYCLPRLQSTLAELTAQVEAQSLAKGNTAALYGLDLAAQTIAAQPDTLCIVGGVDCLLNPDTLNWFEKDRRLKSESKDRAFGLIPAEAVGFMVVESKPLAMRRGKKILAQVAGLGLAQEPAPFVSEKTSTAQGLTLACRQALKDINPASITTVLGDLNGEAHRSWEWSCAEIRCLGGNANHRILRQPAECCGDIGAASGAVLTTIAALGFVHQWLAAPALLFCVDDHGPCGALVLK
ncbi:MAG: beta-ketoacyl synthase N-terminal-like domain-containing protein [Desulfatitalea sp.]